MNRPRRRIARLGVSIAALTMLSSLIVGSGPGASAHGDDVHPAHIHVGDCAAPGEVVLPLSSVGSGFEVDGTPSAGSERIGQESAIPVDASITTVEATLSDIIAGGHTIVIHESAENIQNYIACGDIGGTMFGESDLPIGLGALNDSGYSGIAWLHDNGDGTTTVNVFLTAPDGGDHAREDAAADEPAVAIENFAFGPDTLEVSVGTTVTWTNNDSAPHTVSQSGGGFESGRLNEGETFSFTFSEPGEYEYFCQFHANMTGTVVVS